MSNNNELIGCACRWDADDKRVATCVRHQGYLDVVSEWAERAKAAEAQLAAAQPEQRPTDDALWDKTLKDRDAYHQFADDLAAQIAAITGVDIGEHSSMNNPWQEAMLAADDFIATQIKTLFKKYDAAQQAQPEPSDDTEFFIGVCEGLDELKRRDAAFEAVRKKFVKLPRYSFHLHNGNVRRVEEKSGNWIEFDTAHQLFDPVAVDAATAQQPVASDASQILSAADALVNQATRLPTQAWSSPSNAVRSSLWRWATQRMTSHCVR